MYRLENKPQKLINKIEQKRFQKEEPLKDKNLIKDMQIQQWLLEEEEVKNQAQMPMQEEKM